MTPALTQMLCCVCGENMHKNTSTTVQFTCHCLLLCLLRAEEDPSLLFQRQIIWQCGKSEGIVFAVCEIFRFVKRQDAIFIKEKFLVIITRESV